MADRASVASGTAGEAIAAARRDLGRLLAGFRREAGLSLRQLGRLAGYDHSVVAHSEAGRPAAGPGFWKIIDEVLEADGSLAAGHDRVRGLEQAAREQARQRQQQAAREQRAARRPSPGSAPSAVPPASGQAAAGCGDCPVTTAATVICPNCCQAFELIPRPAGRQPGAAVPS
jgi:hypothetical protein